MRSDDIFAPRSPGWKVVRRYALELGIATKTIDKWRERRTVPYRWRIPLVRKSGGLIPLSLFDALEKER